MEFLKQWSISVCACGIIGTIFSMIAPKGSMEKIVNLVIAVFVFTSILTPFLKIDNVNFEFAENTSTEETLDDMIEKSNEIAISSASSSVQKVISEFLINKNFLDSKVVVEMESDDENNMKIKLINVFLSEENSPYVDEVKVLVENEFKSTTKVFVSEDLLNE